jgi:phosphoribosylglycinamide formyltransferase-1
LKIGVLGSSGGSAFGAFHDIVTDASPAAHTFVVATDRPCGLEQVCEERGIPFVRVEGADNETVSRAAAKFFATQGGADIVILYFLRLATAALYERFPTFNIHPSLLPAFPGFEPVARALEAGVKFFGATLHQVDASVDSGPIVAQVVMPVPPSATSASLEKHSFLHKVYCALLLVDLIERDALAIEDGQARLTGDDAGTDRSNPALRDGPLLERFRALQRRENAEIVP